MRESERKTRNAETESARTQLPKRRDGLVCGALGDNVRLRCRVSRIDALARSPEQHARDQWRTDREDEEKGNGIQNKSFVTRRVAIDRIILDRCE